MNKTSILLALFFLTYYSSFSQADKAIELSKKTFKPGIVKVGLYYLDFPPDIKSLQEKAITNLNKFPEWKGRGIIRMITDGDLLVTYMHEMGITKDEFDKMHKGFEKGKQRFVTDTIQMKITITNNVISFLGKGKLSVINPLSINLSNKSINYDCWTSTKEFLRMNGIIFSSGSEVHLERTKKSKKVKDNLVGFEIGESALDNKTIMQLMLTDDNIESSWHKPKHFWIVLL